MKHIRPLAPLRAEVEYTEGALELQLLTDLLSVILGFYVDLATAKNKGASSAETSTRSRRA